jgi:7,8-dihydropterin-6-yl-methyl-4-(beta-D-ribofuranosyl)aminobenzene 5'-phosphate synthase
MSKRGSYFPEIGPLHSEYKLSRHFEIQEQKEPFWFNDNLVWLGEIPRENDFECQKPVGKVDTPEGNEIDDYLMEDTAFAYKSKDGLVVITACSHPGICNITEYAKKLTGIDKVHDIIGGFHLLNPDKNLISKTKEYFSKNTPEKLHCCHCTDLQSKIALAEVANVEPVYSGDIFEWEGGEIHTD